MAHAANADLVAIVRAGRKLNRLLGGHTGSPAATAIGAGVGHDLTGTAALGADRLERARTKQEGQVDVDVAAPPQLGQVWACSDETEPEPPQLLQVSKRV